METSNDYSSTDNNRNYGIDLLKIISMFMIVTLHILGHGGILQKSVPRSIFRYTAWFIELLVYCSVNCYALISGYVNYGRKHRYSNIIYLLTQVLFYTIFITLIFFICNREFVESIDIIKALFPFAYGTYWYFSAYFCLFFFIPFFDKLIFCLDKNDLFKLLGTMSIIISILPTLFHYDFPKAMTGYSFLWLSVLYCFGGFIKKYHIIGFKKNKYNLLGWLICVVVTWFSKICIDFSTYFVLGKSKGGLFFIAFNSPFIFAGAILLLLYFLNINPGENLTKIISYIVPLTFGVYLFHENPLIRKKFITNNFLWVLDYKPSLMVFIVIFITFIIFIIGICIDQVRLCLFKMLKIRNLCNMIELKILNIVCFLFNKSTKNND